MTGKTDPQKKGPVAFYAIFFWVNSILTLWKTNLGQVNAYALIRPLLLTLLVAGAVWAINQLWMRSAQRAAALTAWEGILFTTYGHVYGLIENQQIGGWVYGRHRYLLLIWLLLTVLGYSVVRKLPERMDQLTRFANLLSLALVLYPLVEAIVSFAGQSPSAGSKAETASTSAQELNMPETLPDVYFIVLDGYGRQDLLANRYYYDNTEFIDFLKEKGFYVADCSRSNYNHTWFSIASTLNMNYIQNLGGENERARPTELIKHSRLRSSLAELGYKMVSFETGYDFTDITDADVYIHTGQSWALQETFSAPVNSFELMYLSTTLATAALEMRGISEDQIDQAVKRDRMEFTYTQLAQVPRIQGPKLVYAHINTTHPPFVYLRDEQQRSAEEAQDARIPTLGTQTRLYRDAIITSDEKMEGVISSILAESATPPIIVLEGDHGPFLSNDTEHLFDNLNAYYFPDQDYSRLYPSISSVNSFKVVLDQFFGATEILQDDISYYSTTNDSWDFQAVPETCSAAGN